MTVSPGEHPHGTPAFFRRLPPGLGKLQVFAIRRRKWKMDNIVKKFAASGKKEKRYRIRGSPQAS